MTPKKRYLAAIPLLITLPFWHATFATEVFHWIDEDGIAHFSQWAPDDVSNVSSLVVQTSNPPGYDPADDPYSIRNQAARINETWTELAARKKERLEEQRQAREYAARYPTYAYDPYRYYSSTIAYRPLYWPGHRPPHRPGHRPGQKPGHRPTPLPVRPPHMKPTRPVRAAAPVTFSPDPMRSAHIGVRRSSTSTSAAQFE